MSQRKLLSLALILTAFTLSAAALPPDSTAPDFTGKDSTGAQHTLSQYRGKYVVLEWANQGCPYEQKHYRSGNMEALQKQWTAKGIVWLSIISSPPGQQGYVTPAQENDYLKTMHAVPTAAILDPTSAIARLYQAKTTPHMFVIDPTGKIIYQGAIDDQPTPDPASLKGANNYLNDALNAALAGKPVPTAATRPYGCSVKYAN
jgi:thioredoxin-related protein